MRDRPGLGGQRLDAAARLGQQPARLGAGQERQQRGELGRLEVAVVGLPGGEGEHAVRQGEPEDGLQFPGPDEPAPDQLGAHRAAGGAGGVRRGPAGLGHPAGAQQDDLGIGRTRGGAVQQQLRERCGIKHRYG
jgi:hypothetical protein